MRPVHLFLAATLAATSLPGAAIAAQDTPRSPGPFIVFFDWGQSTMAPDALEVLNEMMWQWGDVPRACYTVTGHTDRSGSAASNVALSRRMAQSVRDYLTHRGVPEQAITLIARGESRNRLPTRDGVRESQNRRVEVTVAPCR